MKKIGFIGLGIMGLPMAGHLMDAGYEMHIYARHPEKVTSLVEKGATLHSTIHDCVKDVDAVMKDMDASIEISSDASLANC